MKQTRREFITSAASVIAAPAVGGLPRAAYADDANTISVSSIGGNEIINDLLPDFTKATGITVNFQTLPYPALRQRSIAAFVSGNVDSDVYWEDIIWLGEWAKNGYVRPLDDLIARDFTHADIDDFLPGAWYAQSKGEGKTWTMPFGAYYFLNYFRSDLFDGAGIKAPATLDDVSTAAKALNKPGSRQFGIAMPYQMCSAFASCFFAAGAGAGGRRRGEGPGGRAPARGGPRARGGRGHY